jgi:hypothetical protein
MNTFRALCAELADIVTAHCNPDDYAVSDCAALLARALAELAKPEPEGPSLEDLGPLISWLTESATQSADAGRSTDAGMLTWAAQVVGERVDEDATESEPQGPTSDELQTMAAEFAARTPEEFALAVLARWGRPAIEPVPVAERPWEREGWCDAQGTCWMWHPINFHYRLCSPDPSAHTHSLPHWVLPLPATTPTP